MKYLKYIAICLVLLSCGSSQNVIMDSGEVYTVKGNKIYSNDTEVTETLSVQDKNAIMAKLDARMDAEKALDEKQKEMREAQKEADRKAKELKDKNDAIEKRQRMLEDARKDYVRATERLAEKEEKFEKLKSEGKLSPVEIEEYKVDIAKLKLEVTEAKLKLDKVERS